MKINIAVFFGGKSVEHEISVISALQAVSNLDSARYNPIPIYITKNGEMYSGEMLLDIDKFRDIPKLLNMSHHVHIANIGGYAELSRADGKKLFKQKHIRLDVAFPIVHGVNVEDGSLQGYLRMLELPFVGSDVLASAIGMSKFMTKPILSAFGIPVLPCVQQCAREYFFDSDTAIAKVQSEFDYPVIVKPINLGSSVGISIARSKSQLQNSLELAYRFSQEVIIEPAVTHIKEINCAVLGDQDDIIVSECEEPINAGDILDYEKKYMSGTKSGSKISPKTTGSKGMASLQRKIPADIDDATRTHIRDIAKKAFLSMGCAGVARIDFIIDTQTHEVWLNELNTIPGSLAFYLFEPLGISYSKMLDKLIAIALKRKREQDELTYSFETNILACQSTGGVKK